MQCLLGGLGSGLGYPNPGVVHGQGGDPLTLCLLHQHLPNQIGQLARRRPRPGPELLVDHGGDSVPSPCGARVPAARLGPRHRRQGPGGRPGPGAAERWKLALLRGGSAWSRSRGSGSRVALNTWWSCSPTTAGSSSVAARILRRRRGGPTSAPMSAVTSPPAPRLAVRPDSSRPNDTGPRCDSSTMGRSGRGRVTGSLFPVAQVGADCPYGRQRPARSGRQGGAFPLRQPTPNAVPFAVLDRVGGALADHRASAADCLRTCFSGVPLGRAFPIGRKEHCAIDMAAGSPPPPRPQRRCSCVLKGFLPSVHLLPRK